MINEFKAFKFSLGRKTLNIFDTFNIMSSPELNTQREEKILKRGLNKNRDPKLVNWIGRDF